MVTEDNTRVMTQEEVQELLELQPSYRRSTAALLEEERWPGPPGEKPFWWDSCSSFSRRLYLRLSRVREAQESREPRRLEELKARNQLFIRFGEAPKGGISVMHVDGPKGARTEKGLSCFRGRREEDGSYVVDVSGHPSQGLMIRLFCAEKRPVFLATGREIALGSDEEPVLADAHLEPLPEGTRVRVEGGWRSSGMFLGLGALLLGGGGHVLAWVWTKEPEITVRSDAPAPPLAAGAGVRELLEAVLERSTSKDSRIHGEEHWKRVAAIGAHLAQKTPGADPLVVLLFAVLHDSQRMFESYDAWHGWRAAKLARELLEGAAMLDEKQLKALLYAIEHHDSGETSADPTISAAWDSDRLCLWRVGIEPDPTLLSTAAARDPKTRLWARELQRERFTWEDVLGLFKELDRGEGRR